MKLFLKGVGFRNKGAQLMLQAIEEETRRWPVDVELCVDARVGSRAQRRSAGLADLVWFESSRAAFLTRPSGMAGNLIPRPLRRSLDLVAEKELTGVLDASGFSYSDQWGAVGIERMAERSRNWKRRGVPIVLLPQAFGPFKVERVRRAFLDLITNVDLFFARDEESASHIREAGVPEERIRTSPDFTCLVTGEASPLAERLAGRVCLIPNYRMVDKTEGSAATKYQTFLESCVRTLRAAGQDPFVLIHDQGKDAELVTLIEGRTGAPLETVVEEDPRVIKGIVGQASFVIGSRFHGLVSALTQGVPCIGTSWSHKYEELFHDYRSGHLLVDQSGLSADAEVSELIRRLLDASERSRTAAVLREVAELHKARTREMWESVRAVLQAQPSRRDAGVG